MYRRKELCRSLQAAQVRYRGAQSIAGQERQGFGSFHSRDIEEMIHDSQPPHIFPMINATTLERVHEIVSSATNTSDNGNIGSSSDIYGIYGANLRGSGLFELEKKWVFLNHGAFGGALTPLLEEAERWRRRCESQPLRFFDRELLPMVAYSI